MTGIRCWRSACLRSASNMCSKCFSASFPAARWGLQTAGAYGEECERAFRSSLHPGNELSDAERNAAAVGGQNKPHRSVGDCAAGAPARPAAVAVAVGAGAAVVAEGAGLLRCLRRRRHHRRRSQSARPPPLSSTCSCGLRWRCGRSTRPPPMRPSHARRQLRCMCMQQVAAQTASNGAVALPLPRAAAPRRRRAAQPHQASAEGG